MPGGGLTAPGLPIRPRSRAENVIPSLNVISSLIRICVHAVPFVAAGLLAVLPSPSIRADDESDRPVAGGGPVDGGLVSGIDLDSIDAAIAPGENFYLYANRHWLESTKIPADKSDYGIFTVLDDRTREQVRELIEAAAAAAAEPGSATQKVGDLYGSVIDTEARNAAGLDPLRPLLDEVAGIDSQRDLAAVIGRLTRAGVYGPLAPYVSVDARDSDRYTVYLTQAGLTMPDRDYYLVDEERYLELRDKFRRYASDLLARAGHPDPDTAADRVLRMETAIAEGHWTKTENRDPVKTYNRQSRDELAAALGPFVWQAFSGEAGFGERETFVVRQPSYVETLGKRFGEWSLDDWRAYLTFQLMDTYAPSLDESFERRHFDFHATAISGIDEQEPDWKRAVNVTGSLLGELVGQLYVEEHFAPEAKERMNELVENLKRAFEKRIGELEWMGEGTQKQALEKLARITTKIGYPDRWKDYDDLAIEPGPLAVNRLAAARFEYDRNLKKLDGPIDRDEWHMTPQTINAYYNPTMNEIVFPAAILQPPFFNLAADDAVNYGAIGAVIGHELSHAFDDKGSKYDGKGNLRNWWTEEDRREFERRAAGLVEQYGEFEPLPGARVNGELTLGENIGDLGGLSIAHEAYRLSLEGRPAPEIDGLSGDQRFFLGWAQIWRRLYREPELRRRLIVDPHSPSEYRVNGIVRNMDAWYEAFDIPQDQPLSIPAEQRVRIW